MDGLGFIQSCDLELHVLVGRAPRYRRLPPVKGTLGPDHPDRAMGLNNFVELLQGQGNPSEACVRSTKRASAIDEKVIGPEHPYTAMGLSHPAAALQNQA